MILWMAILGALVGWCLVDFEEYGFLLGSMVGGAAGWIMARHIRAQISAATAGLQSQIDLLLAREITPSPSAIAAHTTPPFERGASPARVVTPLSTNRPTILPDRATPSSAASGNVLPPATPAPPPEPGLVETLVASAFANARNWLLGGNTIVRIGLVILFVGLSFLASYAASAGLFPIELRLVLIVAIGIGLLAVGFRTRTSRPGFGLALQGAGIATIYLTLFAAAKLFDTIPIAAAFALMIVVCALGCALALLQRSQALATTAFAGGFAVPLLLAGGGGSVVGVFAYYTILNLAILFIAHRQSWRVLNLTGFFATFGTATLWGMTSYQTSDYGAAQAFLIVSVLIYVATAVRYARATMGLLGNVVDTTLMFGPALAGFGLQVGLVHDQPFGSAFAALGFAALYLAVAMWTMLYRHDSFRVMNETMLAIGIGFVTLAVPLALGARWTSAAWALEGAGAFWVGMRQARWMPRLFGLLLQAVAALLYLGDLHPTVSAVPLANPNFVGGMLIALAALATAWWLRAPLPHSASRLAKSYAVAEVALAAPAFLVGFAFWWLAWTLEVGRSVPPSVAGLSPVPVVASGVQPLAVMLAYVASAWGAQTIGRHLRWPVAGWPSYATLAALVLAFVDLVGSGRHVLYLPDAAIWIGAIGLHVWMLYQNDAAPRIDPRDAVLRASHIGGVWLLTAMLTDGLSLAIDRAALWDTAWAEVTFLVATVAVLVVLTLWGARAMKGTLGSTHWPLDRHAVDYGWYAAAPIAALVFVGSLLTAMLSSGNAIPLPYFPLLNPVDLALGLSLLGLELWRRTILASDPVPPGGGVLRRRGAMAALAGLAFVMVNTVWLRIAHHLLGVAWDGNALLDSFVVQTGLAILWTLLAVALMVTAHRGGRRVQWLVGAGLLGLTVVKLLLVDLNNAGGGARIVAFIVVGMMMLMVGYLAPLPPQALTAPDSEDTSA
ncbi:DUF2339 domain-containing protein [Sphingomonas sp. Leaf198]|uniref:DUF2339 domain-containing protein n=2 Tax=unclassified Sphingomonas TaxID=196159 RepID=UPI0006FE97DF|nr:DUF2339 domain-containing protein [Sphingomonas sp. Leaf198]KQS51632.1 hypothetical protein ASG20_06520 [Sphingomonas sp. Leaf198]